MFTPKHYEALATMMQETKPTDWSKPRLEQWEFMRSAMCNVFEASNPKFNRARFIAACEPDANVRARPAKTIRLDSEHALRAALANTFPIAMSKPKLD